ncbi:hypothetical protein ACP70R_007790 [Stipagrostis hirtigluma subsp. patula]
MTAVDSRAATTADACPPASARDATGAEHAAPSSYVTDPAGLVASLCAAGAGATASANRLEEKRALQVVAVTNRRDSSGRIFAFSAAGDTLFELHLALSQELMATARNVFIKMPTGRSARYHMQT